MKIEIEEKKSEAPDFGSTSSKLLLAKAAETFARAKAEGKPDKLPFDKDGWYKITPELAYLALRYSVSNRPFKDDLRRYGVDMLSGDWRATGQPILFNENGLIDGHNRLMACLLSDAPFETFVVVSAKAQSNDFAYIDIGRGRSIPDAVVTAGLNGLGKAFGAALKGLLIRYDNNALGVYRQPRYVALNSRHVLAYLTDNPQFAKTAHRLIEKHLAAVKVIGQSSVAVTFAYLVTRAYGEQELDRFCQPLASGANLSEDDPVLAYRNLVFQWDETEDGKLSDALRLALLCKAFLMWHAGQRMPRKRGNILELTIGENEPFPRIDPAPLAQAAE